MDELISRIDELVDESDDEGLDDWAYGWSDSWRWAPEGVELPSGCWEDQADAELDSGWDYHPDCQIHVIPSDQVDEWMACLEALPTVERDDIDWYVVCFTCMTAGDREVTCDCGNPSSTSISR